MWGRPRASLTKNHAGCYRRELVSLNERTLPLPNFFAFSNAQAGSLACSPSAALTKHSERFCSHSTGKYSSNLVQPNMKACLLCQPRCSSSWTNDPPLPAGQQGSKQETGDGVVVAGRRPNVQIVTDKSVCIKRAINSATKYTYSTVHGGNHERLLLL